jgi:hypothetical protein
VRLCTVSNLQETADANPQYVPKTSTNSKQLLK